MFGAVGGGVITREGLREAQRISSPVSLVEDALVEAMRSTGSLRPAEAREALTRLIARARAEGVDSSSPQFRKAEALLAAMEVAAPGDSLPPDPHQLAMEAIHADEYAFPDLE